MSSLSTVCSAGGIPIPPAPILPWSGHQDHPTNGLVSAEAHLCPLINRTNKINFNLIFYNLVLFCALQFISLVPH